MTVAFAKVLNTSAVRVWDLITDTQTWSKWGPSIRAVDTQERFIRRGSTGRIRTIIGMWLPFTITTYEPQQYWDWRVGGIQATGHRLEPWGPKHCRVSFIVPVWGVSYGIVCRIALNRIDRLLTLTAQED